MELKFSLPVGLVGDSSNAEAAWHASNAVRAVVEHFLRKL